MCRTNNKKIGVAMVIVKTSKFEKTAKATKAPLNVIKIINWITIPRI